MNSAVLIIILTLIIVAPAAYFLGWKAYATIVGVLAVMVIFLFVMMYAYWYIFVKREF